MSKSSQFIHKRREYRGKVARAFGGNVASWGPWETVGRFHLGPHAKDSVTLHSKMGLYQHAIFYKGKRLT